MIRILLRTKKKKQPPAKQLRMRKKQRRKRPSPPDQHGRGFRRARLDRQKGQSADGEVARLEGKTVVLLQNEQERRYPLDQFSYDDKRYIRQAALELQKYQKFAGNRESVIAQNMQRGPTNPPQLGGMPLPPVGTGMNSGSPLSAMQQMLAQQQADAARCAQTAMAEMQNSLPQAPFPGQDALTRQQQIIEQGRQRMDELQKRQAEAMRQFTERTPIVPAPSAPPQPVNAVPVPPVPVSAPVDASPPCLAAKVCMSCNKPVPNDAKVGDRCPHCGVIWDVEEDERGNVISRSTVGIGAGIGGIIIFVLACFMRVYFWRFVRER